MKYNIRKRNVGSTGCFGFSFWIWLYDMPMNERIKAFRFGIDNKHFSGALNGQNL